MKFIDKTKKSYTTLFLRELTLYYAFILSMLMIISAMTIIIVLIGFSIKSLTIAFVVGFILYMGFLYVKNNAVIIEKDVD